MNAPQPETHFASAARTAPTELARRLALLTNNPVTDTLLETVGGLLAILDGNRQILAVNHAFLESLGYGSSADVLGLRPGEAIRCIHAHEAPNGCGTTPHCTTCGAVIAMVTALAEGRANERVCVAEVKRNAHIQDLVLRVRASPIDLGGEPILLLFLQDAERRAAPRLAGAGLLPRPEQPAAGPGGGVGAGAGRGRRARAAAPERPHRAAGAPAAPRGPVAAGHGRGRSGRPASGKRIEIPAAAVMDEVRRAFLHHPAARGRTLTVRSPDPDELLQTDLWLLVRVLTNLVVNALEATEPGGRVEAEVECEGGSLTFHVRNGSAIPRAIQPRIFQKNFSTKQGPGHGLGAWSARLFGEGLLGGEVGFTTSDRHGTDFTVRLPRRTAPEYRTKNIRLR